MKTAETKTASPALQRKANKPFFGKSGNAFFGTETATKENFFSRTGIETGFIAGNKPVQAKLSIGKVNDPYEKEADAMADKVVQRQCKSCDAETTKEKEEEKIQKKEDNGKENAKKEIVKKAEDTPVEKTIQKKAATTEPVVSTPVKAITPMPVVNQHTASPVNAVQAKSNNSTVINAKAANAKATNAKSVNTNTTTVKSAITAKAATAPKEEQLQKKEEENVDEQKKLQRKPIFDSNAEPPDDENTLRRKCRECEEGDKILMKPMPGIQRSRFDQTPKADGSCTSIVAAAQGELGKVEARLNDGTGNRVGAERLLEYFHIAAPGVWDDSIISTAGANMPSWCGIFSVWAHKKAGKDIGEWQMGKGVSAFGTLSATDDPQPGDIGYINLPNQHHAIVKEVAGDTIHTIDGNSGKNKEVIENAKPRSEYTAFLTAFGGGGASENVQAKEQGAAERTEPSEASSSIESRLSSSKGGGSSLPEGTRDEMEQSFGADFSDVRIHTDNAAQQMSSDLNAQAFTHGSDIYFNSGKFDAGSNAGRHLLAHELTHTIQQGGNSMQKEPAANTQTPSVQREPSFVEKLDKEKEEWDKAHDAFLKKKDYHDASYSLRVLFLLNQMDGTEFEDEDDYYGFLDDCEFIALDEDETLAQLDKWAEFMLLTSPDAFPITWSQRVYDALYIKVDEKKVQEEIDKSFQACEEAGNKVPDGILEKGLPVNFKEALQIKKFDFKISLINSTADSAIIDLAKAGRNYMAKKWVIGFYITWNAIAENVRDGIKEGTLVVDPLSYKEFQEKQKQGVQELSDHIASATDEFTVEKINADAKKLKTIALLMGLGATLGGLVVGLSHWKDVRKIFEDKMAETDGRIAGMDKYDRIATALKWAYENGYFGEAGAQLWDAIKENWRDLLKTMAIFVIVQFIPYLNIAVDAIVILHSGVDALEALKNLVVAFNSAAKAANVISMQREAAKLAKAVVGEGIRLIIDLVGIITGVKGVKAKVNAIKLKNPGMAEEEALNQALKEQGLKGKLGETVKGAVKVDEAAEIVQKLGGVTEETIENLKNNPKLRNALFENRRAASVLKRCASPCFPPNATEGHVTKLEELLKRAEAIDAPMDKSKLKEFFYGNRDDLDGALGKLDEYLTQKEIRYVQKKLGLGHGKEPEPDMRFESPQGTKVTRGKPGFPTGGNDLPVLGKTWLDAGISQIPGQIASKIKNMFFKNWDDFRQTFWKLVAKDPELSQSPYLTAKQNPNIINMGKAPYTKSVDATGKGVNAKYQIDHGTPINIGGETYNLDELYVVTPKIHGVVGK